MVLEENHDDILKYLFLMLYLLLCSLANFTYYLCNQADAETLPFLGIVTRQRLM